MVTLSKPWDLQSGIFEVLNFKNLFLAPVN